MTEDNQYNYTIVPQLPEVAVSIDYEVTDEPLYDDVLLEH